MSDRARKRQQTRQKQTLRSTKQKMSTDLTTVKVEEETKVEEVDQPSEMSKQSVLEKAADAVLCQVFAFLNAREHWKFSRSSSRVNRVSHLMQASPQQLDVSREMQVVESLRHIWDGGAERFGDASVPLRLLNRLMEFRPLRLTAWFTWNLRSIGMGLMTQLRELTFSESQGLASTLPDMEWLSQLTQLTKLKMCVSDFYSVTRLPSSLNEIDLLPDSTGGFQHFKSTFLFKFTNLQALQVLKLPSNSYYGAKIFEAGTIFPLLRELSLGFAAPLTEQSAINLQASQFCANLQSLSVRVDFDEFIFPWETLAAATSLRRLNIYLFNRTLSSTLFDGLANVTQLTQLKITSYNNRHIPTPFTDVSDSIRELTAAAPATTSNLVMETNHHSSTTTTTATATSATDLSRGIFPRLTSLFISDKLWMNDASCLSSLSTLTELELPASADGVNGTRKRQHYPNLPHLRTLHLTETITKHSKSSALDYYKDQVTEVILRNPSVRHIASASVVLTALIAMKKLTNLKLHPSCTSRYFTDDSKLSTTAFEYFRRFLPTVQVEIDNSIDVQ